jgi:hypothetical protein
MDTSYNEFKGQWLEYLAAQPVLFIAVICFSSLLFVSLCRMPSAPPKQGLTPAA